MIRGTDGLVPGRTTVRLAAAGLVLLALLVAPAPLLPPHALAESAQSFLGVSWKTAYLVAALGLQGAFYGSLGALATLSLHRAPTPRGRRLQVVLVPWAVVGVAVIVRSMKAGHLPVWTNAIVPILACLAGVGLGLGWLYRRWLATLVITGGVIGTALWAWLGGPSSSLSRATEMRLQRLAATDSTLPTGDTRFGVLLRTAFAVLPDEAQRVSAIEHNRAAILALGIAIGDARLARLVGLERDTALVRQAVLVGGGATLRGREDWAKHYAVSAALAVLEHPVVSDAAGLMKEQLDALTQDTGFSFGDIAADRAGVRFAAAATRSEAAAEAMQARLHDGFEVADFFPPVADLPEKITVQQFRQDYGSVGSQRYRQLTAEIEARLARCPGLSPQESRRPAAGRGPDR